MAPNPVLGVYLVANSVDSSSLAAMAVADTMLVGLTNAHTQTQMTSYRPWWIDAVIAFVAALIGALVGGRAARDGAISATREQQRFLDDAALRATLGHLKFILEGTEAICIALPNSNSRYASAVAVMHDLIWMWAPFDELANSLHLLNDHELEREIYIYCQQTRMLAGGLIEAERRFEVARRDFAGQDEQSRSLLAGEREAILSRRQNAQEEGPKLARQGQALLDRLAALQGHL